MGAVLGAQETILDESNLISLGTNCGWAHTCFGLAAWVNLEDALQAAGTSTTHAGGPQSFAVC